MNPRKNILSTTEIKTTLAYPDHLVQFSENALAIQTREKLHIYDPLKQTITAEIPADDAKNKNIWSRDYYFDSDVEDETKEMWDKNKIQNQVSAFEIKQQQKKFFAMLPNEKYFLRARRQSLSLHDIEKPAQRIMKLQQKNYNFSEISVCEDGKHFVAGTQFYPQNQSVLGLWSINEPHYPVQHFRYTSQDRKSVV